MKDTIPAPLKPFIFSDKVAPNLAADYDVIGFDADHCLVKYNIPRLSSMINRCFAKDLTANFGYPPEISQIPDELIGISLNNAVWDIENRTLLKLGEGKVVLRACKGSTVLDREAIEELYGSPPVFHPLDYPRAHLNLNEERGAHWTLMTYFEGSTAPLIAHGIDLMEQGLLTGKTNLQFAQDVIQARKRQFSHYTPEEVFALDSYGEFFPAVKRDPHALLHEQPELREVLETLREKNVRLFLGTNSHLEFMNLIMSSSLGKDWKELFDIHFSFCQKPGFFSESQQGSRPFYPVDHSTRNMSGAPITNGIDL